MSAKEKRYDIAVWFLLLLSVCTALIAGYALWEIRQGYYAGDKSYKELVAVVRPDGPPAVHSGTNIPDTPIDIPDMRIDFAALRKINPNAAAWLYCPDTAIDYPVMQAKDYDYYLHHLPDGTPNDNGSLFIDYNNAPDFNDSLTVIYGHHMKSGRMFGTLTGYKEQAYFEEHPYMYLYTGNGKYRIDLLYNCVISGSEWREQAFMFEANLNSLLTYAAYHTTFISEALYTPEDKVIALSTCSYEFDDARYVVIGVLREA